LVHTVCSSDRKIGEGGHNVEQEDLDDDDFDAADAAVAVAVEFTSSLRYFIDLTHYDYDDVF
jgi:hypothetical protein